MKLTRNIPVPYTPADLEFILLLTSTASNIEVDTLRGERGTYTVSLVRQVYCYIAFRYTKNTMKSIGKHVGNRNHTLVLRAVKLIKNLLDIKHDVTVQLVQDIQNRLPDSYTIINRTAQKTLFKETENANQY